MDEESLYYLAFSHFLGIGPVKFNLLINYFKSAELAYKAKEKDLTEVIGISLTNKFIDFRNSFNPEVRLKEIYKKEITVITCKDKNYPAPLKNISDPPICLYLKGNYKIYNFKADYILAVVGTRKPTSYGYQITQRFTRELVEGGFVIVSGLALGIDTVAHQTTLACKGRTIAILGCGVDIIYPAINQNLYHQIIGHNGLVISEFPPGQTVLPGLFVARNRLVSGLAMGVMVIEGTKKSGSLITSSYAASQGKEVFAPPVPLTSEMSEAPNILLKQGAKLVTTVEDIFDEFNLKLIRKDVRETASRLNGLEGTIFEALNSESKSADELVVELKQSIHQILNSISALEIKGLLEKDTQGKYQIRV